MNATEVGHDAERMLLDVVGVADWINCACQRVGASADLTRRAHTLHGRLIASGRRDRAAIESEVSALLAHETSERLSTEGGFEW